MTHHANLSPQLLSLTEGTANYAAAALPDTYLPPSTAAPYFDDLYQFANETDGIWYSYNTTAVYYEWILSREGATERYHFTLYYDSNTPAVFTYSYYATGGTGAADTNGKNASVGIQGVNSAYPGGTAAQFSFDSAVITPGLVVVCNTNTDTGPGSCVQG